MWRYESFGGLVSKTKPNVIEWVDKDRMKYLGHKGSSLWNKRSSLLSAPVESHLSITNNCNLNCKSCYVKANSSRIEPPLSEIKKRIDLLRKAGIFSISIGGGEPTYRKDLDKIVGYIKKQGLKAIMTSNGYLIKDQKISILKRFDKINISIDGFSEDDYAFRDPSGLGIALSAMGFLKKNDVRFGISILLSRKNYDNISSFPKKAIEYGADSIFLLRCKPYGYGADVYNRYKLTNSQIRSFYKTMKKLILDNPKVNILVDCSFMPFIFANDIDMDRASFFNIMGCEAAGYMVDVDIRGEVNPCGFISGSRCNIQDMKKEWSKNKLFRKFRAMIKQEPCRSCKSLVLCRGGCKVISKFLTGKDGLPDPECPKVIRLWQSQ